MGGVYAFLRSPKWVLGHVLVLVVVVTFVNLGFWQLRRLDEVRAHNAQVSERMEADPVSLGAALDDGRPFTRVTTSGEYLLDAQLLTAPRSRDGNPGHHVLTPLETDDGTVLVERGWVPFRRDGVPEGALEAPDGEVTVSGLLMPAEEGDPGEGEDLRVIDPGEASERTGVTLADGYVRLLDSEPEPAGGPIPSGSPSLDEGNHLSYAVQWFLFTLVVAVGYPLLIWRTARERRDGSQEGDEQRPRVPAGA